MQTTILCTLPPQHDEAQRRSAAAWRGIFAAAGIGAGIADWNTVRCIAVKDLLWLIAGEPGANDFLMSNLDAIAANVAAVCSAPVPMEVRQREVAVRAGTDKLWAYRVPRFVAEKQACDWTAHFVPTLGDATKEKMARKIEASLRRELSTWSRLPEVLDDGAPFITISDPGRAIPIQAISSERSGHGKPVSVLARSHLTFLSYWRFEGEIFVGPLASLGYGRVLRTAAPELLSRDVQRELLKIMPQCQENV